MIERLGVVLTGGTMGSRRTAAGNVALSAGIDSPELELVRTAWNGAAPNQLLVSQPFRLSSEELLPEHWVSLAEATRALVADDAGAVLILHGTDSATYSTAALSFLLSDLAVPVLVTGSTLPPDHAGSDARTNVAASLVAARHLPPGVYLVFAEESGSGALVHLGTEVRKIRASQPCLESVNRSPVARIEGDRFQPIDVRIPSLRPPSPPRVDARVLALRCHPGLDFSAFGPRVESMRGVVVELYPSATGPSLGEATSLVRFTEECVGAGLVVVGTLSAAPRRTLPPYESTMRLIDAGMIVLPDLLPEVALVKLMLALGSHADAGAVASVVSEGQSRLGTATAPVA